MDNNEESREKERLMYALGILGIIYISYGIFQSEENIFIKTTGSIILWFLGPFIGLYILFYGLSLVGTLNDNYKELVNKSKHDIFAIGFELAIFFTVYYVTFYLLIIYLPHIFNLILSELYRTFGLIFSLVISILVHRKVFRKSPFYTKLTFKILFIGLILYFFIFALPGGYELLVKVGLVRS